MPALFLLPRSGDITARSVGGHWRTASVPYRRARLGPGLVA
jgi:hypothetical protein